MSGCLRESHHPRTGRSIPDYSSALALWINIFLLSVRPSCTFPDKNPRSKIITMYFWIISLISYQKKKKRAIYTRVASRRVHFPHQQVLLLRRDHNYYGTEIEPLISDSPLRSKTSVKPCQLHTMRVWGWLRNSCSAASLEGKGAGRHTGLAAVQLLRAELGKRSTALMTETPTSPTYTIIHYWHRFDFHDVK